MTASTDRAVAGSLSKSRSSWASRTSLSRRRITTEAVSPLVGSRSRAAAMKASSFERQRSAASVRSSHSDSGASGVAWS